MIALPRPEWWRGRRVLVTGHTGFVGGWLCAWLAKLEAQVSGFALGPPTTPSFFEHTKLASRLHAHTLGDINDFAALSRAVAAARPQVIFHLAAQPIVREAYRAPVESFATNVMGTVHLLEAARAQAGLERLVVYTTDKVYRNDQSGRAFSEEDRVGGNEPYSASKAGAEHAVAAWWESYFRRASPRPGVATIRAGNIIGGGDWGKDRVLPDAIRAFAQSRPLVLRSPASTRPWQHVLDAVRGTLLLAEHAEGRDVAAETIGWNLGPPDGIVHPVSQLADAAVKAWGTGASWKHEPDPAIPESKALVLSSARASGELGWRCAWDLDQSVSRSVAWYRAANEGQDMWNFTLAQIAAHGASA